jgi:hypothetical protein
VLKYLEIPFSAGFIRYLEKLENLEKSWNLKIGQKVMENRVTENLEKSWNLPPGQKLKMFKLNIKFFRKTACGAFPFPLIFLDVLHIAYFI